VVVMAAACQAEEWAVVCGAATFWKERRVLPGKEMEIRRQKRQFLSKNFNFPHISNKALVVIGKLSVGYKLNTTLLLQFLFGRNGQNESLKQ
jgi:hypothetical protein